MTIYIKFHTIWTFINISYVDLTRIKYESFLKKIVNKPQQTTVIVGNEKN